MYFLGVAMLVRLIDPSVFRKERNASYRIYVVVIY